MSTYIEGALVQAYVQFTDNDGNPVDPDTIRITVTEPDGTEWTKTYGASEPLPNVVRDGQGSYLLDIDTTGKVGTWCQYWHSTGSGQAAYSKQFDVRPR